MSEGGLYTRPWVVRAQENFWITCTRNFAHLAGVRWGACSGGDHHQRFRAPAWHTLHPRYLSIFLKRNCIATQRETHRCLLAVGSTACRARGQTQLQPTEFGPLRGSCDPSARQLARCPPATHARPVGTVPFCVPIARSATSGSPRTLREGDLGRH